MVMLGILLIIKPGYDGNNALRKKQSIVIKKAIHQFAQTHNTSY